ncbi:MAG: carbamoyltransferase HypF, partial [Selenomonadaceae bacterium]|nr:carbamoyltransferase HypF [Selenomonadaceae bacterium]
MINVKIYGVVQGVGFRPFVARLADKFSIVGTVANKGSHVEIIAGGSNADIDNFIAAIRAEAPPRSTIIKIDAAAGDGADHFFADKFSIVDSTHENGSMFVSPDIAICDQCRAELFDRSDRRYLHPFINCTDCGPRLTILKRMPYDRERTSMSAFPMCDECSREYHDPSSRRYDAQPVCCNDCGPTVYILDGEERGLDAISLARRTIIDGGIVAVKGIGGFHLACDAFNHAAVERLRRKKFRPSKPFAVMFRDIETVRRECLVDDRTSALLEGHKKPIVLFEKKSVVTIADNVAPFNRRLGVMLPYTPLHLLLFDLPDG